MSCASVCVDLDLMIASASTALISVGGCGCFSFSCFLTALASFPSLSVVAPGVACVDVGILTRGILGRSARRVAMIADGIGSTFDCS